MLRAQQYTIRNRKCNKKIPETPASLAYSVFFTTVTCYPQGSSGLNIFWSIDIDVLYAHKDILLSNLNSSEFLNRVVSRTDLPKRQQLLQSELVELALDEGADAGSLRCSLEVLVFLKDVLLSHPTNPISPDNFLKLVLEKERTGWSYGKQVVSSAKSELIREL